MIAPHEFLAVMTFGFGLGWAATYLTRPKNQSNVGLAGVLFLGTIAVILEQLHM